MIITILIAIVFFFLLAKAILETVYGTCLIIQGIACHILAAVLRLTAKTIRFAAKLRTKSEPRRLTLAECFLLSNFPGSPEAKRIRATIR